MISRVDLYVQENYYLGRPFPIFQFLAGSAVCIVERGGRIEAFTVDVDSLLPHRDIPGPRFINSRGQCRRREKTGL